MNTVLISVLILHALFSAEATFEGGDEGVLLVTDLHQPSALAVLLHSKT